MLQKRYRSRPSNSEMPTRHEAWTKLSLGLAISILLFSSTCDSAWGFTPQSEGSSASSRKKNVSTRKKSDPLYSSSALRAPLQSVKPLAEFRDNAFDTNRKHRVKRKYQRKRTIPETERQASSMKKQWKAEYERIVESAVSDGETVPNLWSFESMFPEPILDEASIRKDLYGSRERDAKTTQERNQPKKETNQLQSSATSNPRMKNSFYGGSSMMRVWREKRLSSAYLPDESETAPATAETLDSTNGMTQAFQSENKNEGIENRTDALASILAAASATTSTDQEQSKKVDRELTRMVEDSMYGYRRTRDGSFQYETSLLGDGAVKFRDGVRLGKALKINADRLTYLAKKELQHGRVEEAQELYEQAIRIDPQDGRAYLGLSRCAQRRKDFTLARECLKVGITHSTVRVGEDGIGDYGANPFLLQALGVLEEKMGHLSAAETLYLSATKSRPWHAAAWVALAQLRTRKLGQSAEAGRALYQTADRELKLAGKKPSSHVYTAWAALEYRGAGDVRRARELFKAALKVDKRCSAAYLQLGVMEADSGNWEEAQNCFETVLKFDQRNSRVLQAYALMETKRPDGDSRKAIGLFERALKAKPRDAGVLQAYGLYVAQLGDIDAARDLLMRATKVNKRHSAAWQAWGVLETKEGNPEQARSIFQQGIWACAQMGGGQSGGYSCARLWQAWGVLEAQEEDFAAARRCFSRALDADSRNVATMTAWALMEEELGNVRDARAVLERALKQFAPGSDSKGIIWMTYENMEKRLGNTTEAQRVYQRSMRETFEKVQPTSSSAPEISVAIDSFSEKEAKKSSNSETEVEISRWDGGSSSLGGEVWMNDRAIESKVPKDALKRNSKNSRSNG